MSWHNGTFQSRIKELHQNGVLKMPLAERFPDHVVPHHDFDILQNVVKLGNYKHCLRQTLIQFISMVYVKPP